MNPTEQYVNELRKRERRGWMSVTELVLSLLLLVLGMYYGVVGDYAHGAFYLILSSIVRTMAIEDGKKAGLE